MRKLTDNDLSNIAGAVISGYHVEGVRIKRGTFIDSDHYGVILGKNFRGHYVTWEFHLDEGDKISAYWGHYFEDRESAIMDFHTRDVDSFSELSLLYCDRQYDEILDNQQDGAESLGLLQQYKVTITETLKKTVTVEAESREEAEQMVSDDWDASKHILGAEDFVDVEFHAVPSRTSGRLYSPRV